MSNSLAKLPAKTLAHHIVRLLRDHFPRSANGLHSLTIKSAAAPGSTWDCGVVTIQGQTPDRPKIERTLRELVRKFELDTSGRKPHAACVMFRPRRQRRCVRAPGR
jgi:hypothetical protein